jgi:hypothetical protein
MAPVLGVTEVVTTFRAPLFAEQKTWKQNLALSDFFYWSVCRNFRRIGLKIEPLADSSEHGDQNSDSVDWVAFSDQPRNF